VETVHDLEGTFLATSDFKRHDCPACGHLLQGQVLLRVIGAHRIPDARDTRLFGQEIRNCSRGRAGGIDTKGKRFDTFQQNPRVER